MSNPYPKRLQQDHIRLLWVDSASASYSFRTYKLSEAPDYTCISYTWGPTEALDHDEELNNAELNGPDDGTVGSKTNGTVCDQTEIELRKPDYLSIDGKRHAVSSNVLDIFCRLETFGVSGYVWLDALCVNQLDVIERSEQVSIMGDIFHKAKTVAVWLGLDQRNELDEVVRMCDAIHAYYAPIFFNRLRYGTASTERDKDELEPSVQKRLGLSFLTTDTWKAFTKFWYRTWFQRVWVVQEAALATTIRYYWGSAELDAEKLIATSVFMSDAGMLLGEGGRRSAENSLVPGRDETLWRLELIPRSRGTELMRIYHLRNRALGPAEKSTFSPRIERVCDAYAGPLIVHGHPRRDSVRFWTYILSSFRTLMATDPRDHVYATLGIINAIAASRGWDPPDVVVDYAQPAARIYADVAGRIMQAGNTVNLLCLASAPCAHSLPGLPSWVPDFSDAKMAAIISSSPRRLQLMPKLRLLGEEALERDPVQFKISSDLKTLDVKALLIDEIVGVGPDTFDMINEGAWETTAQILLSRNTFNLSRPEESRLESLWRTLLTDTSSDGKTVAPPRTAEYFRAFVTVSLVRQIVSKSPHFVDSLPLWKELTAAERALADSRKTENPALITVDEVLEIAARPGMKWHCIKRRRHWRNLNHITRQAFQFIKAFTAVIHRRIIITKQGYLGLAPYSTLPGDLVWLMPGAPLPTVLRRNPCADTGLKTDVAEQYTLHGEAYLYSDPVYNGVPERWRYIQLA